MIAVTIDDHSGQPVALAPNDATQFWIDPSPVAVFGRLANAAFEKIKIEVLALARKTARHDLRLGIVNRAPDQAIATVLERNDVAVYWVAEYFQHLARKNPVVSVQNSGARFDDYSCHGEEW